MIRWGILSTARIADRIVDGARGAENAQITAVGSRDLARARGWAVLFGVTLLDTGLTGNARNAAMGEQILRRI